MTKFSSRYKYDPNLPKTTVFEDAPYGLRIAYINSILEPLTHDISHNRDNSESRPLESVFLIKQFCSTARQEIPDFPGDTTNWTDLKGVLTDALWFRFYDFVECVGKLLKGAE